MNKNELPSITKTKKANTVYLDPKIYDHKIKDLQNKKLKVELYNQMLHGEDKYVVILGKQLGSSICVCWSNNKQFNNRLEISSANLNNVVLNNDPVYDYIFDTDGLKDLYNSISDRKLRSVAREATMSLDEVFQRFYLKK